MDTPLFLDEDEILVIHQDQLERYGGSAGIRDRGLLMSALAQPSASFGGQWLHCDLFEMAAAYLVSLAMNHPFVDGNKRVGTMAALLFLDHNGIEIDAEIDEFERLVLDVAAGSCPKEKVAGFFRTHARSLLE